MIKLTASNIVAEVGRLPRNRAYNYVNPKTKGLIEIVDITRPEGPITIKRYNPSDGETSSAAKLENISSQMIWRIANAFTPGQPINFDRVLGASYNTRSVLEALVVHTPQFYTCNPGRIETTNASSVVRRGHKHVVWYPDNPHALGIAGHTEVDVVISEMPNIDAYYESLTLPDTITNESLDIEVQRRHAQIQIALIMIGKQPGFRTWIAQNDKGIIYNQKRIADLDGVVASLQEERVIARFEEEGAIRAARLIDCIWFKNGRLMPAVMEIEHTTGITSGLSRMKRLQDTITPFPSRYVIVAADEDRDRVVREISLPQFSTLNARYFPYSAVEELYALCQRRKIRGVTEEFLDCYMEEILKA